VSQNSNASILIVETEHPEDIGHYRSVLARELPMVRVHGAATHAEAAAWRGAVTAVIGKAQSLPATLLNALPDLNWIQALTTGVDPLMAMNLPPNITITSARGIHGPQMSELCFMHMLMLLRDYPLGAQTATTLAGQNSGHCWHRRDQH
jgi:D-2-hydroxyacid dehydrogenase (NADP+)